MWKPSLIILALWKLAFLWRSAGPITNTISWLLWFGGHIPKFYGSMPINSSLPQASSGVSSLIQNPLHTRINRWSTATVSWSHSESHLQILYIPKFFCIRYITTKKDTGKGDSSIFILYNHTLSIGFYQLHPTSASFSIKSHEIPLDPWLNRHFPLVSPGASPLPGRRVTWRCTLSAELRRSRSPRRRHRPGWRLADRWK